MLRLELRTIVQGTDDAGPTTGGRCVDKTRGVLKPCFQGKMETLYNGLGVWVGIEEQVCISAGHVGAYVPCGLGMQGKVQVWVKRCLSLGSVEIQGSVQ